MIEIVLFGAGGYGALYAKELLENCPIDVKWAGVVDPFFASSSMKDEIERAGIPVYASGEDFYKAHRADLAVICTPPFLHREQTLLCLQNGSYVLCEKPVAPTVQEAEAMLAAERQYGKFVAIGYQWSYSNAILALKKDIRSGKLGSPVSFKTFISWPRNFAYYKRGGGWGGRVEKDGITVLDSIASNACAHYLHNMLFLLGEAEDESAEVTDLCADCLRAYDIETFDTCTISAKAGGVPIYFAASHAAGINRNPTFEYRFTGGLVVCDEEKDGVIEAILNNGERIVYGSPSTSLFQKLWICVDAMKNGQTPVCTVKTAMAHTKLIEKLHQTVTYRAFSKERIETNAAGDGLTVKNLYSELERAYQEEKLLSEL